MLGEDGREMRLDLLRPVGDAAVEADLAAASRVEPRHAGRVAAVPGREEILVEAGQSALSVGHQGVFHGSAQTFRRECWRCLSTASPRIAKASGNNRTDVACVGSGYKKRA